MDKKQTIFIIKNPESDDIDGILAIVDSQDKAQKFIKRYKTEGKFEILEQELNPSFITDKNQDPYEVEILGTKNEIKEIMICPYIIEGEWALADTVKVNVYGDTDIENASFYVYVFGCNKYEAASRALKLRDNSIARGDWEKANQVYLQR